MGLPALLCALAVLSCPISPSAAATRIGESLGRRAAGCQGAAGGSARFHSARLCCRAGRAEGEPACFVALKRCGGCARAALRPKRVSLGAGRIAAIWSDNC